MTFLKTHMNNDCAGIIHSTFLLNTPNRTISPSHCLKPIHPECKALANGVETDRKQSSSPAALVQVTVATCSHNGA